MHKLYLYLQQNSQCLLHTHTAETSNFPTFHTQIIKFTCVFHSPNMLCLHVKTLMSNARVTDVNVLLTQVSTARMHVFTLIQCGCLVILWIVKSSPASLALPFILILTIPLRMVMTGRLFSELEIKCVSNSTIVELKVPCRDRPEQVSVQYWSKFQNQPQPV